MDGWGYALVVIVVGIVLVGVGYCSASSEWECARQRKAFVSDSAQVAVQPRCEMVLRAIKDGAK
jgi:hypothetical protein